MTKHGTISIVIALLLAIASCLGTTEIVKTNSETGESTVISLKKVPKSFKAYAAYLDVHSDEYKRTLLLEKRDLLNSSYSAPQVLKQITDRGNYHEGCEYINSHNLMIGRICNDIDLLADLEDDKCDEISKSMTTQDCSGLKDAESATRRPTETELRGGDSE